MGAAQRVVLVSNRLPPTEDLIDDGDIAIRQVSGLVSALRPVLSHRESLWFGWSGGTTASGAGGDASISDFGPRRMVALDLPGREASLYYNTFSNRTLWPLLHNYPDRIVVRSDSYSAYRRVNRRFAESLSPHLRPDDTVWVHDFHLFPLASALRELGWTGKDRLLPARPISRRRHLHDPAVGAGAAGGPARVRPGGPADSQPRPQPDVYADRGASRRADRRRIRLRVEAMPGRRLPCRRRSRHVPESSARPHARPGRSRD